MAFSSWSELSWQHLCGAASGFCIFFRSPMCLSVHKSHILDYCKSWNWVEWFLTFCSSFHETSADSTPWPWPWDSEVPGDCSPLTSAPQCGGGEVVTNGEGCKFWLGLFRHHPIQVDECALLPWGGGGCWGFRPSLTPHWGVWLWYSWVRVRVQLPLGLRWHHSSFTITHLTTNSAT